MYYRLVFFRFTCLRAVLHPRQQTQIFLCLLLLFAIFPLSPPPPVASPPATSGRAGMCRPVLVSLYVSGKGEANAVDTETTASSPTAV